MKSVKLRIALGSERWRVAVPVRRVVLLLAVVLVIPSELGLVLVWTLLPVVRLVMLLFMLGVRKKGRGSEDARQDAGASRGHGGPPSPPPPRRSRLPRRGGGGTDVAGIAGGRQDGGLPPGRRRARGGAQAGGRTGGSWRPAQEAPRRLRGAAAEALAPPGPCEAAAGAPDGSGGRRSCRRAPDEAAVTPPAHDHVRREEPRPSRPYPHLARLAPHVGHRHGATGDAISQLPAIPGSTQGPSEGRRPTASPACHSGAGGRPAGACRKHRPTCATQGRAQRTTHAQGRTHKRGQRPNVYTPVVRKPPLFLAEG
jgi:hypothetical protein